MTPIRALLIDLDGTLVETSAINFASYAAALAEVGVNVERDHFDAVAQGRNWRQFLPTLLAGTSVEPASIARRKTEIYGGMVGRIAVNTPLVRLIESSRPTFKTALVTTASKANAGAILARHELQGLFDVVVNGDDVTRHKPDPEAYVLAARQLHVEPEACLVFEDSEIGIEAARRFGASVIRIQIYGNLAH